MGAVTEEQVKRYIESQDDELSDIQVWDDPNYIPRLAILEYISSASFLESGAYPTRSKIFSGSSPLLYALTISVDHEMMNK